MNSTFRYAILSAVLAAGPAMAGDFQALGSLSFAALDEAELARIEGGAHCSVSNSGISGVIFTTCQKQTAAITQANVAIGTVLTAQTNAAGITQSQTASQSITPPPAP